jgi:hypothetical protein
VDTVKTLAFIGLGVCATLLFSACSTNVESTPTEEAGYCNNGLGIVRHPSAIAGRCAKGEVCALDHEQMFVCCSIAAASCGAQLTGQDGDDGFYCSEGGIVRLPIRIPGQICKPGQVCAPHNTHDCHNVCCSLDDDPECGVAMERCSVQ